MSSALDNMQSDNKKEIKTTGENETKKHLRTFDEGNTVRVETKAK